MKDILQREINVGDLVLGMIVSRDSDGMRFGVYNGSSCDSLKYNKYLVTSVMRNMYLITNPTKEELEIKAKITQMVDDQNSARKAALEAKKALTRIPKKDLVVGEYYRDDTDRTFFYLGRGTVTTYDNRKRNVKEESGYIYLSVSEYNKRFKTHITVNKSLRKIVAKEIPEFKVFRLNLNKLEFSGCSYWNRDWLEVITLNNKDKINCQ